MEMTHECTSLRYLMPNISLAFRWVDANQFLLKRFNDKTYANQ